MSQETYYLLGACAMLLAAGWAVFKHLLARIKESDALMIRLHEERKVALNDHRKEVENKMTQWETKFEASGRRLAEVNEKIALAKLEQFQAMQNYATRSELDKRLDSVERKLDVITEHFNHHRQPR